MFEIKDYPQVYLLDGQGHAERLIFKQNTHSMLELIGQIVHGKGKKTINVFSHQSIFGGVIDRMIEFKSRFRRLIIDDASFGILLLICNILFLLFSWRISGALISFLYKIVFAGAYEESSMMDSSKRSQ